MQKKCFKVFVEFLNNAFNSDSKMIRFIAEYNYQVKSLSKN